MKLSKQETIQIQKDKKIGMKSVFKKLKNNMPHSAGMVFIVSCLFSKG